ncbi:MAG: 50S ribosomal protein L24 [Eubacteriales bacterium]|nr:50S ribosomal protein L24 [Eubacteriales bacterium]MDD4716999.1 50S ribosomal protein L24 [Eubacteriales bacterium]NCU25694.1 50S ribosomal protein L24 [Candidatus Nomurabacteria bacterium]
MMAKVHVKKNDNVFVLTGKDAGKTGKVLEVDPAANRVIVEGVSMSVKHKKPRGRNQQGGIIHQESSVHASNVMVVCDKCKRPAKIGKKILPNGEKVRVCKSCGEIVGTIKSPKQR